MTTRYLINMNRPWLKFCGLSRPEDVRAAAELGADAIGLVFHAPSPRNVSLEQARILVKELPSHVTPVALFVDVRPEQILETVRQTGAAWAQLHGRETLDDVAALNPLPVIKAIHVHRERLRQTLAPWRQAVESGSIPNLRALLLETAGPMIGGSGMSNDWETIAEARSKGWFDDLPPLIAAGGLTAANVGEVVRGIEPWGVDVSSGIESAPGLKSRDKMAAFARAIDRACANTG